MSKRRNCRSRNRQLKERGRTRRESRLEKFDVETLESRQLLAGVMVGNSLDVVNAPDVSSIAALIADDGGDAISLREAITAANNTAGSDTITFDAALFGTLTNVILSGNTASNGGGAIFNAVGTVTIKGSTISGNSATGTGNGGGIIHPNQDHFRHSAIASNGLIRLFS